MVFRAMPVSFLTFPNSNKTLYERIWCRAPSTLLNTQKSPKHNVLQTNQLQRYFLFINDFLTVSSLSPQVDQFPNYIISTDQTNCKRHLKRKTFQKSNNALSRVSALYLDGAPPYNQPVQTFHTFSFPRKVSKPQSLV